jgi:NAD(P)-dependent dehydrogenase (short-subunit alcohol dehydrogenase family)
MSDRNFDKNSTADDVLDGIDLAGKLVLVTGASGGLGAEAARAMAAKGAAVAITGRDLTKTEAVAARIREAVPGASVEARQLALDVPSSVRAFAKAFLADHPKLDILLNNAGVMACPLARTAEGWEQQLATNHVGHFLLTGLLAPALRAGAPARVVNVSSGGHLFGGVDFDDPHFERRPYDKFTAYGQSKTANILHALELDRRLAPAGIRAFAIHPGAIMTELGRHLTADDMGRFDGAMEFKTVPCGAATEVYAATAPELEGRGGLYLEDCQVSALAGSQPEGLLGVAPHALDAEAARRLWTLSEELVGETFDLG